MGMFDSSDDSSSDPYASSHLSDMAHGLDNFGIANDDPSILSSIGNLVTKGVPLTGLSIVNSFANTAIDVANWATGSSTERLSVENELGPGAYNDYYNAHEQGIEFAGLAIGSLAPGLGAIKALKALRLGLPTNALVRATNIFAGPQAKIIDDAVQTIEAGNGALFQGLGAAKYKAIALGYGEQALQAIVYQTATLATMKASPLLDKDGLSDTLDNMFFGALTGGVIGGTLEQFGVRALFNKAELFADTSTKAQEITTRLGGKVTTYSPGDRIVSLIQSLDDIPTPTSVLGKSKLARTTDAATLEARKILTDFVPEGDEVVANKMFDSLLDLKSTGDIGRQDFYERLYGLTSFGRINGPIGGDEGKFYFINRLGKGETVNDWTDLVTPAPRYGANTDDPLTWLDVQNEKAIKQQGVSLRYRLSPDAEEPSVGFSIETPNPDGSKNLAYNSAKAAFADGHDVFVDAGANNKIYVNPDSENLVRVPRENEGRILSIKEEQYRRSTGQLPPGSAPLESAGTIYDTISKKIKQFVSPTVGDLGRVEPLLTGVRYGNEFSNQALSEPIGPDTSTLDANARYVWANKRGIIPGDRIDPTDSAMLEKLYKDGSSFAGEWDAKTANLPPAEKAQLKAANGWQAYTQKLEGTGVKFSDGSALPASKEDAYNLLKDSKDQIIADTIANDSKLSSEEAARRANVSEDYILNKLQPQSDADLMVPPEQSSEIRHIRMSYDLSAVRQQDGQILKGLADTQYRIDAIDNALKAQFARYFGSRADAFLLTSPSKDADLHGAGSTFLGFASAGYRSLGQQAERVGREVRNWTQNLNDRFNTFITPSAVALRNDPEASAEAGNFIHAMRATGEAYAPLPEGYAAAKGLGEGNFAVLSRSLIRDSDGSIIDWDKDLVPKNFIHGDILASGLPREATQQGNSTYYQLGDKTWNFLMASRAINDSNVQARNSLNAAWGLSKRLPTGDFYAPPINISQQRNFAMVKLLKGTGGGEDDVHVITALTKQDLETKVASLQESSGGNYSVYYKDDLKKAHEVMGDYEYSRNFANTQVNSDMKRAGILNDIDPETRGSSIVQDYVDWHYRQNSLLTRDHVELGNGQLFSELRAMGEKYAASESSQAGFVSQAFQRSRDNPYDSYVKTSLDISPKENYRLWSDTQEKLESFYNTAFASAKNAFIDYSKGLLPAEQAAKMSENFGLKQPYGYGVTSLASVKNTYEKIANQLPPARSLSNFISSANTILGATVIKLDTWQQLIHVLSTPILLMSEGNSFRGLLTTALPDGSGRQIPAISKVMFQALRDYFDTTTRETNLSLYEKIHVMKDPDTTRAHWSSQDALTLPQGSLSESGWTQKISDASAFAQKWLGTNASEQFTSWMAARVGHILGDAAGSTGQQLLDDIGTFVNRVKGNAIASQRPVAFQGPLGQAIGLFQTYQFNLMQNLFRYVENGDAKTLAILGGMQTTLFGLQGLPGFSAINNHIVGNAATNPLHKDAYSAIPNLLDKTLGDYLLYGVTSNILGAGLYTRGDINPRQLTLLPVNPLQFPAIAGGIRFMGSLYDTAKKISDGGPSTASLLQGLEHNGLSRPLGGIAQLAQGFGSTSQTSLISTTGTAGSPGRVAATNPFGDDIPGLSELFTSANLSRLLGARPLDEAVVMDGAYRSTLYNAKDQERKERLGERVRSQMINGTAPSSDDLADFAHQYQAAGGRIQEFGKSMQKWTQESKVGVANEVFYKLGDPRSQVAMQQMGGQQLPDFRNQGRIAPANIPANAKQAGDGFHYVPDSTSSSGWSRVDPTE
jgi:hypothetical protein